MGWLGEKEPQGRPSLSSLKRLLKYLSPCGTTIIDTTQIRYSEQNPILWEAGIQEARKQKRNLKERTQEDLIKSW